MNTVSYPAGGRIAVKVASAIAERYVKNASTAQAFLPPERVLAAEYGVARSTMRRALAMLERQGIIRPEHGRGCRILHQGEKTAAMYRVAVLQGTTWVLGRTSPELVDAIQRQCLKRKWQVLSIDVEDTDPEAVLRTLAEAKVDAVALVIEGNEVMQCLVKAGIHCVAVETSDRGLPIDQVYQDNYGAAAQAVRYLVEKGHRRIGWIGPVKPDRIAIERFAGARSTLIEHHLDFHPADIVACSVMDTPGLAFLSRENRPPAVLTMWHGLTLDVLRAAAEMGIGPGSLDMVGWGTEKQSPEIAEQARLSNIGLATMIWSVEEMAEVVVSRIQLHRMEPALRPLHIVIPSRMVVTERMAPVV